MNPEVTAELQRKFGELLNQNEGEKLRKIINIDGKTMKGNHSKEQDPLHVVSAYSKTDGICFGQVPVQDKSNEITAIPQPSNL